MSGAAASGVAVVTGAGSATGIGIAVARALGRTGLRVVIASTTDRIHERAADLRREGIEATGVACDLTTEAGVAAFVAAADGGEAVDVLVNNAGMAVLGEMDSLTDLAQVSLEQWQRALERNLTTAFLVTRAILPGMQRRGYGRIVNVASTTGTVSAVAGDSAYAAAKAGMVGFTRAIALESASLGVTVNATGQLLVVDGGNSIVEDLNA